MKKESIEDFIDKYCLVSITHKFKPGALFHYYGRISKITDDVVIIENDDGKRTAVMFDLVKYIRETSPSSSTYRVIHED